jgi:hypothetical protein
MLQVLWPDLLYHEVLGVLEWPVGLRRFRLFTLVVFGAWVTGGLFSSPYITYRFSYMLLPWER